MVRQEKEIKILKRDSETGFTLIELLVVVSIMGIMLGLVLVSFGTQRSARNLKIAQNELVTNLRKVQGYALSSRSLSSSVPAQFYIMKFDSSSPNSAQYEIQAVYDYFTASPKLQILETIKFPAGLQVAPVTIATSTTGLFLERPVLPTNINSSCVLLAFKVPFGDVYMNDGCVYSNFSSDDYQKLINFVTNSNGSSVTENSNLTIRVQDSGNGNMKTVTVRGVSGKITAQ
jgi:prepilin-type N-terminal cleavage/methylation domain-containing protein